MTCQLCGGERTIAQCGDKATPDPCLGMIPGVVWACCGHGRRDECAYVVIHPTAPPMTSCPLLDGETTLRGEDALAWFAERGLGPDAP